VQTAYVAKLALYGVILKVITTESDMQNCLKRTLFYEFTNVNVRCTPV